MKIIEHSAKWYETVLLPALQQHFPEELGRMAIGVAGRGSECFGFDDEISRDHDTAVGVSLWLSDDDDRSIGVKLHRLYRELHRKSFPEKGGESVLGFAEHGVDTISGFFRRHLGIPGAPESWQQWLAIPEYALAEAVNGQVFYDGSGEFSGIRQKISDIPEDIRRKKIAGHAVMAAQSGQYNFARCLKHGESGAAMLALSDFVRHAGALVFWLNGAFPPYYKWLFRAMRQLPELPETADKLEKLLTGNLTDQAKISLIEEISAGFTTAFAAQNFPVPGGNYLEPYAFALQKTICDQQLRSLHIMEF